MTDDIAGQYSDYQDNQDRLNRTPNEEIKYVISEFLSNLVTEHTGITFSSAGEFDFEAGDLIKQLEDNGFEITVRKEVSNEDKKG